MLRLTARYADSWNTCWLGQPTALAERRTLLEAACVEEGRDPNTLAVTVGVSITYTAPGETVPTGLDPAKTLSGSVEDIAAALDAYRELGVAHLTCALDPFNAQSLAWLAEAVQHYRTQRGSMHSV
jgi:alkanesulfonate monooxygenase SsuD/methylene tetrahydromethanopterin reductase-like flavin-dependent oxidoreductase (luciferase family)